MPLGPLRDQDEGGAVRRLGLADEFSLARSPGLFVATNGGKVGELLLAYCSGPTEWIERVHRAECALVAGLMWDAANSDEAISLLRGRLPSLRPHVRIIALTDGPTEAGSLPLAYDGTQIFLDSVNIRCDPVTPIVSAHLYDAPGLSACADTLRYLSGRWGAIADQIIWCALGSRMRLGNVEILARFLGLSRWTLCRRMREQGLSSPEALLDVIQVALASSVSVHTNWTSRQVGRYVGFADERAIRTLCKRMLDCNLGDLALRQANCGGQLPDDVLSVFSGILRS